MTKAEGKVIYHLSLGYANRINFLCPSKHNKEIQYGYAALVKATEDEVFQAAMAHWVPRCITPRGSKLLWMPKDAVWCLILDRLLHRCIPSIVIAPNAPMHNHP